MLSVIILYAVMLSLVVLSIVMLIVVMLSVIMVIVVAPLNCVSVLLRFNGGGKINYWHFFASLSPFTIEGYSLPLGND